jgi:hypothetical protein
MSRPLSTDIVNLGYAAATLPFNFSNFDRFATLFMLGDVVRLTM